MIKFQPLFFIVLTLFIALGYKEQFFIMFLVVTLHELSHIAVGLLFGLKFEKITFTPLGQIAVLKNLEYLNSIKKICVMLAGPLVNLILWGICEFIFVDRFVFFKQVNMAIFLFNILPVYPLDGGKIWQIVLGNSIGVMNANRILMSVSKVVNALIFLVGLIQAVLFPFNVSLICLAIYLHKINEKEYMNMTFEFYRSVILNYNKVGIKKQLPLKFIVMDKSSSISLVINRLSWDNFYVVYIADKNSIVHIVDEFEIVEYATTKGLNHTLEDVI